MHNVSGFLDAQQRVPGAKFTSCSIFDIGLQIYPGEILAGVFNGAIAATKRM
jgi:hypothetical protein